MISCTVPTTAKRNAFLPMLLRSFNSQTIVDKELIVVSEDDIPLPKQDNIFVVKCEPGLTIGEKRNIAVQASRGQYVAHLDSDDYSAPRRLEDQLWWHQHIKKAVTGYFSIPFYNIDLKEAYCMKCDDTEWSCGNCLFYDRQWAVEHPFHKKNIGEDGDFLSYAAWQNQVVTKYGQLFVIAIDHSDNTSTRDYNPWWYQQVKPEPLREILEPEMSQIEASL